MPPPPGTRGGPLLGRRRECEELERLVADVTGGTSRVLVLRGDAGVGKSALLHHFVEQTAGWRVLSAEGVESEMELAYSGVHQLCAPLLDRLDLLPAPQRDALATVFGLSAGSAPDRLLVALAVLSLVAEAAEERPLACVVDDAQWLDGPSRQVVGFVARRLSAERVAVVCALRTDSGDDVLTGMPTLEVRGLPRADARTLLLGNVHGPLDPGVTERIVAECDGNPLALLELPRTWTSPELAGGFGLPGTRPVTSRIEQSYVQRLQRLPRDSQLLVLAAAAEPLGDAAVLRRAAALLGVDLLAAVPAEDADLLHLRGRVEFAHSLVRSAAYASASAEDRRRVHRALAQATDAELDRDRRAWHLAGGTLGPDEEVAVELERSADRAQTRAGLAAAAAFLTRAADVSADRAERVRRALDAASANVQAGAFDTARRMLAVVCEHSVDERHRAQVDVLLAQLAFLSRRGNEAPPLLLAAARRLERVDPDLARETYLDAFSATQFAGRLSDAVSLDDLAGPVRRLPRRAAAERTPGDVLLDAFAALAHDYAEGVPVGRQALATLRDDPEASRRLRWLWQGCVVSLELWDDDSADALSARHLEAARRAGALTELPLALSSRVPVLVLCGALSAATGLIAESRSVTEATGIDEAPYGPVTWSAWRGRSRATKQLIEVALAQAWSRGEGIGVAVCEYARAVLCNALGEHDEALEAASVACADPRELVAHNWGLPELVESAARTGRTSVASEALSRLASKARSSGSAWALGTEARARALVSEGPAAEQAFRTAIEHLGRTRVRTDLARSHLLYGEWLRQVDRRLDARGELRTALDLFSAMGAEAFAERARRELQATGATVRSSTGESRPELSAQELQIARLARDGFSNPEIGAQLFISARTVEWHLRKVFSKLGISSRRDLQRTRAALDRAEDHASGA